MAIRGISLWTFGGEILNYEYLDLLVGRRPDDYHGQLWSNWERSQCAQSYQLDCYVVLSDSDVLSALIW